MIIMEIDNTVEYERKREKLLLLMSCVLDIPLSSLRNKLLEAGNRHHRGVYLVINGSPGTTTWRGCVDTLMHRVSASPRLTSRYNNEVLGWGDDTTWDA